MYHATPVSGVANTHGPGIRTAVEACLHWSQNNEPQPQLGHENGGTLCIYEMAHRIDESGDWFRRTDVEVTGATCELRLQHRRQMDA